MRRLRIIVAGIVVAGTLALAVPTARAETPAPVPGEPSCPGLIVATLNQGSGVFGPSGNPQASAGPGVFFGPGTLAAIEAAREFYC